MALSLTTNQSIVFLMVTEDSPNSNILLADPGKARGSSTNTFVINSLTDSVSLFLPELYGAAAPNQLEIAFPVIK